MELKTILERPLFYFPWLHAAILLKRRNPDINKLAWISLLNRGQVVLDIGANRGNYTSFFARKVGPKGRVYAFEPVPETCDELRIRCLNLDNVCVYQVGLSDVCGPATIHIPGNDFAQASLEIQTDGSWAKGDMVRHIAIDLRTLDSWVREVGLERIDFIKIDVEGAEMRFLRGARDTLQTFGPALYMEIERRWQQSFGTTPSDVIKFLGDLGYRRILKPVINGIQINFIEVSVDDIERGDFLFLRDVV